MKKKQYLAPEVECHLLAMEGDILTFSGQSSNMSIVDTTDADDWTF